jgi:HK97 family phage prohead protease
MSETRKVRKLYNIDLQSVDEDKRQITFCFSDDQPDRDGEIVDQSTWDTENYRNNPVILWGHDPSDNANILGQGVSLDLNNNGKSFITAQFDDAATNPKADQIFRQLIKRTLRTVSAGFISHTFEIDNDMPVLKDNELLEVSVVAIPSNPRAIARAYKAGEFSKKDAQWMMESMRKEADALEEQLKNETEEDTSNMNDEVAKALLSAVTKIGERMDALETAMKSMAEENIVTKGSTSLPLAPEDRKWDAGAAIKNVKAWASNSDGDIDFKKYGQAFFAGSGDKQGDYKLPFADVIDGKLTAVWHGVSAAYAAVEGARGGVEGVDKDAALAQIKKYYKRFGKDVPEKAVDLEDVETKEVDLTDTKTKDADTTTDTAADDTADDKTDKTTEVADTSKDEETKQEDETTSTTDDVAKDGGDDQSGATTEEIDGDAELTPELQAEIDRSLESAMANQ